MTVSPEVGAVPPLSRLHLSSSNYIGVSELLEDLKDVITIEGGEEYIKGENDTFHIEKQGLKWSLSSIAKALPGIEAGEEGDGDWSNVQRDTGDKIIDYSAVTKRVISHESEWPGNKETPYFNHFTFYDNLKKYQQEKSSEAENFGNILLYGEVVTSTSTMLEK